MTWADRLAADPYLAEAAREVDALTPATPPCGPAPFACPPCPPCPPALRIYDQAARAMKRDFDFTPGAVNRVDSIGHWVSGQVTTYHRDTWTTIQLSFAEQRVARARFPQLKPEQAYRMYALELLQRRERAATQLQAARRRSRP